MREAFQTGGLKSLFSYPFRQEGAGKKLAILAGFFLSGWIIPVIPWFFFGGYIAEVTRRAANNEGEPELPGWQDWNGLLADGLRVAGVSLFYLLPVFVIFGCGFLSYFGFFFTSVLSASSSESPLWGLGFISAFSLFLCSLVVGTLFVILAGLPFQAALTHVIFQRSFSSFFHVKEWWQIFIANLGGYVIAYILLVGIFSVCQFVSAIFGWTFFLFPLAFLLPLLVLPYLGAISAYMYGKVYREGLATLKLETGLSENSSRGSEQPGQTPASAETVG
jgi:hypothetical protein